MCHSASFPTLYVSSLVAIHGYKAAGLFDVAKEDLPVSVFEDLCLVKNIFLEKRYDNKGLLDMALRSGSSTHLQIVLFRLNLTIKPILKDAIMDAFRLVCLNGHLAVAQWLCETFQLTAQNACSNDGAFSCACENGHLGVAQWLYKTFQLTRENACSSGNQSFRWACGNGHLEVAQWLHLTFQLTTEDARLGHNDALHWACYNGHLEMAQWLYKTFELTREDAFEENNWAYYSSSANGHSEISMWLLDTFGLFLT